MIKLILYIIVIPLVIYSLSSININSIFKKNKLLEARLFYFFLAISEIYLVVNFLYDILENTKIF